MPHTIILLRHGKPQLAHRGVIAAADMPAWVRHYDDAGVEDDWIPAAARQLADSARWLVSSALPRARASALLLGREADYCDALFNEAELPRLNWSGLYLPPAWWTLLLRVLWLLGYGRGCEPLSAAARRADQAAVRLVELAQHGSVVLVGHGVMNRLIAQALTSRGWVRQTASGSGYWSQVSFSCPRP